MSNKHKEDLFDQIGLRGRSQAGPFKVARVKTYALKAKAPEPVKTSFGVMEERPALLVRIEDQDGTAGWGEAWCNFPIGGAAHRAILVERTLAPLILGKEFSHPGDLYSLLTERVRVLAIQTGEDGPLSQAIAALDIAAWDMCGHRAGVPLFRLFGSNRDTVPTYASGINPKNPERTVRRALDKGFSAFKLKIGFDDARDTRNLSILRDLVGFDGLLMVDANQAWTLEHALKRSKALEAFKLGWLEEPIPADSSTRAWQELRSHCDIPLAAGENIRGLEAFQYAIASRLLDVLQPDLAKWGGFSACLPVARVALKHGLRFCPHYLGGGVGLLAAAHLLAAAGGDGMLEVDVNENPLRSEIFGEELPLRDGNFKLPASPGLGMAPDPGALERYAA